MRRGNYQEEVSYAEDFPVRRVRHGIKIFPILLFIICGTLYYLGNRQTVPFTGRKQIVDISREQEMALGLQSYQQVLQQERVLRGGEAVNMVRAVGEKIAAVSEVSDFEWEFNVVESPEANAFCLPGGKVVVNTGILPVTQNADGLAVVMGHEIAHAIARHGAERMAQERLKQFGQMAVGMATSDMDQTTRRTVLGVLGAGAQFGILLPFSRTHESEADHIGLILLARACFDPSEATKFWGRMSEMGSGAKPPEFASTHPSHDTRIDQLKQWLPEALVERQKYCGNQATSSVAERSAF